MSKKQSSPRIVVIGGGTGSFTLLSELKHVTPYITAVVNMSDDGGSTGRLRDELGALPPGDIRQCLVALSNLAEARDLFNIRFDTNGPLDEHSLGNLILSGLEHHYGSFEKAIETAAKLLQITGQVVPVTTTSHTLVLQDGDQTVSGEFAVGHHKFKHREVKLWHEPAARLRQTARTALLSADLIVIAPGNLYGSLLPALAVEGMPEALKTTKAKKVMVANLVTKPGQTDGWHITDYLKEIERYTGHGSIDAVLYNTKKPTSELLSRYAANSELPVGTSSTGFKSYAGAAEFVGRSLLANRIASKAKGDKSMPRTLIRHDATKVTKSLMELL